MGVKQSRLKSNGSSGGIRRSSSESKVSQKIQRERSQQKLLKAVLSNDFTTVVDVMPLPRYNDDLPVDDENENFNNNIKVPRPTVPYLDDLDCDGKTVLMRSIENGNYDMALFFLQSGSKLGVCDCDGNAALHLAVDRKNRRLIELLIQHGANINVQDELGCTPLMKAAMQCSLDVIQLLLKYKVNVMIRDEQGNTALHHCCKNDAWECAELLIDYLLNGDESTQGIINWRNNDGDTSLHVACKNGATTISRILTAKGCNSNIENRDGKLAVQYLEKAHLDLLGW